MDDVDRLLGVRWIPGAPDDPVPEKVCITGRLIFRRDFSEPDSDPDEAAVDDRGPCVSEMAISSNGKSTGNEDSSSSSSQTSEPRKR